MEKRTTGKLDVPNSKAQISYEELTTDLSAFLHFLRENYDGEKGTDIPSFWMLIPKSIDVEYRPGTKEFYLEKELFSRRVVVVAEPPPNHISDSEKMKKRAELLTMFQDAILLDQIDQLILLMSRLRNESRQTILENFKKLKAEHGLP